MNILLYAYIGSKFHCRMMRRKRINDLNSVLLEGKAVSDTKGFLSVSSQRVNKQCSKEFTNVLVDITLLPEQTITMIESIKRPFLSRVVGRLAMNQDKVVIIAELVEIRKILSE